jgi:hypothetical protein
MRSRDELVGFIYEHDGALMAVIKKEGCGSILFTTHPSFVTLTKPVECEVAKDADTATEGRMDAERNR